ncbi:hypothetical protein KFL_013940010, partial [Klebsormidium nitens]
IILAFTLLAHTYTLHDVCAPHLPSLNDAPDDTYNDRRHTTCPTTTLSCRQVYRGAAWTRDVPLALHTSA